MGRGKSNFLYGQIIVRVLKHVPASPNNPPIVRIQTGPIFSRRKCMQLDQTRWI